MNETARLTVTDPEALHEMRDILRSGTQLREIQRHPDAVQEAAETVVDTAKTAAKTIKEEMDKAWQAISAEDQPEAEDETVQEDPAVQDAAEEPAADPEKGIPAVPVNPDDSAQE